MKRRQVKEKDLHTAGMNALLDALGSAGAVRFLYGARSRGGDYTAERHKWLDESTVDEIFDRIKARRAKVRRR